MGMMDWFKTPAPQGKLDEPCVACGKTKRTLCIRSSKPNPMALNDFGHANLALITAPQDGSAPQMTTYGNWPSHSGGWGIPGSPETSPTGTTIQTNAKGDWNHQRFKYVRCKEIDDKQYQQLMKATQNQNYD